MSFKTAMFLNTYYDYYRPDILVVLWASEKWNFFLKFLFAFSMFIFEKRGLFNKHARVKGYLMQLKIRIAYFSYALMGWLKSSCHTVPKYCSHTSIIPSIVRPSSQNFSILQCCWDRSIFYSRIFVKRCTCCKQHYIMSFWICYRTVKNEF